MRESIFLDLRDLDTSRYAISMTRFFIILDCHDFAMQNLAMTKWRIFGAIRAIRSNKIRFYLNKVKPNINIPISLLKNENNSNSTFTPTKVAISALESDFDSML